MKKALPFLIILLAIAMLAGCTGMKTYEQSQYCPPPLGPDGQAQESLICEKCKQLDQAPENFYLYIFDAAAIASLWPDNAPTWFCDFNNRIACWYISVAPNVSPADIITKVLEEIKFIQDPNKARIIRSLIRRNFMDFWDVQLIKPYDDSLIRGSNNWLRTDFGCGALDCN